MTFNCKLYNGGFARTQRGLFQGAVTAKLSEVLGEPCDEVFPEYITVMISNGKTIRCGKECNATLEMNQYTWFSSLQ